MKAIKILCFSFFLGLTAAAQQAQSPEQNAQALTQSQTTMLKLTAAQQEQVYTIHLGIAQKNQGIFYIILLTRHLIFQHTKLLKNI